MIETVNVAVLNGRWWFRVVRDLDLDRDRKGLVV